MDPRSSYSTSMTSAKKNKTKGNENESKGVQFSEAELPLTKFIGAANRELPEISRKILPFYHWNTKLGRVLTNAIRPIAGVMGA